MCPPMRAHWCHLAKNEKGDRGNNNDWTCACWRHLANMIKLVLPSAHPSPQPKLQIDQFSCFCTTHGRKYLYFTMGALFPKNCPFPWGDLDLLSYTWLLGPIRVHNPNDISISSAVFAPQSLIIFYKWDAPSTLKIAPSHGGIWTPSNTWFSWANPSRSIQTASRSVQPFLQGSLVWQTDRQTDWQTTLLGR